MLLFAIYSNSGEAMDSNDGELNQDGDCVQHVENSKAEFISEEGIFLAFFKA